jgi:hypothetical protein
MKKDTQKIIDKKPESLNQMIRRIFSQFTIRILIILEVITMVSFGFLFDYIEVSSSKVVRQQIMDNVEFNSQRNINYLDEKLLDVKKAARLLQQEHELFFKNKDASALARIDVDFKVHENGALYKTTDNGGSSVYYAASHYQDEGALEKAILSEDLDPMFKMILDEYPLISVCLLSRKINLISH